jgi:hypothetical protein
MTREEREMLVKLSVENCYSNITEFLNEYAGSPKSVFKKVVKKMKIIPFDIKNILKEFYEGLMNMQSEEKK